MYKVKPLFEIPDNVPLPDNMYVMSPISPESSALGSPSPSGPFSMASMTNGMSGGFVHNTRTISESNSTTNTSTNKNQKSDPNLTKENKKSKSKDKSPSGKNESQAKQQQQQQKSKSGGETVVDIDKMDFDKINDNSVNKETFEALENRQLAIISKLTELKSTITILHKKCLKQSGYVDNTNPSHSLPDEYIDVVINADPRRPPYSLLFFRKILQDYYGTGVTIKTFVHSSCTGNITKYLEVFNTDSQDEIIDVKESLVITVIWKNLDLQTELIVNPIRQVPIVGEGNLCRFFSRIIPLAYPLNYDTLDWGQLQQVDKLIEEASEKIVNFDFIEAQLKVTGPFLLGEMTIADFVFFSAASNVLIHNYGRLVKYPKTQEWLMACQNYGHFQLFSIAL